MVGETKENQNAEDSFDEEPYNEEEDEDFDPNTGEVQQSGDDDADEEDYSTKEGNNPSHLKRSFDYSGIESETGGLIRTRRGRLLEAELNARRKYEDMQTSTISDSVNDIWEELKRTKDKRLNDRAFSGSVLSDGGDVGQASYQEEQILIKRDYKFAGEVIHEEKMVPISSSVAQEYLKSIKLQKGLGEKQEIQPSSAAVKRKDTKEKPIISDEQLQKLRRPLKRPPILEQIIAGSLKPKLTTLEKSSLDWAAYVDEEGLNDELTLHNKDGYLAKQDFLNRVEMFKDDKYRELRQKQLAMQLQQQQP